MELADKVIFITGSSSGIGKAMALAFAKEKAKVVVTYHTKEQEGEQVLAECKKLGASDTFLVQLDIKDTTSIQDCVKEVINKFGSIDLLINDAGVIAWKKLEEQNFEDIENQIRTNLEGTIKVTCTALSYITTGIICVASQAGERAIAGLSVYCASKFGVRGFVQSIAQEVPNLKIFSVCPGLTATQMTNFKGVSPDFVAELVLKTLHEEIKIPQGGDLNIWEFEGKK